MKKAISLILTLATVFCAAIPCFAAIDYQIPESPKLICLGDSIICGCYTESAKAAGLVVPSLGDFAEDTFAYRLAELLYDENPEDYFVSESIAFGRVEELLYIVSKEDTLLKGSDKKVVETITDDLTAKSVAYYAKYYKNIPGYNPETDDVYDFLEALRHYNLENIPNAEIITLSGGMNNFTCGLYTRYYYYKKGYWVGTEYDFSRFENYPEIMALVDSLEKTYSYLKYTDSEAYEVIDFMVKGIALYILDYYMYYDQILDCIYDLNPNAEVYITGPYNNFDGYVYEDEYASINIGLLLQPLWDLLNSRTSYLAENAKGKVYFVDIKDTETLAVKAKRLGTLDSSYFNFATGKPTVGSDPNQAAAIGHPSEDGYKYMASQIKKKYDTVHSAVSIDPVYPEWVTNLFSFGVDSLVSIKDIDVNFDAIRTSITDSLVTEISDFFTDLAKSMKSLTEAAIMDIIFGGFIPLPIVFE